MKRLGIWLTLAGAIGWLPAPAVAATGAGFVISPAFAQVKVAASQAQVPYTLQLTNHNTTGQNFRLSVVDFGSLDEEGGVAFLGTPSHELEHKYGLASWLTLEKNAVFIPAGASVAVAATIANRSSLAPGGHYGAILATAVTDTGAPAADSVGVKQVLSSLILTEKEGGEERVLHLASQTVDGGLSRLPTHIEHRFQNTGNIHLIPRGVVTITDPLGHTVARGALNEESAVILPESFRRYKLSFLTVGIAWLPGRYAVTTTYRYEGTDQTKTLTTQVWYAGLAIVWIVIVLALALAGTLGWWLWRRRF